jgi:hypothetical protein
LNKRQAPVALASVYDLFQPRRRLSLWPTLTMASMAGISSRPRSVNEYSTVGGEVGATLRDKMPSASSFLSRAEKTLGDTPGISDINSLNRLGSDRRYQITFGVHAPPNNLMLAVNGHSSGGDITFDLRRLIGTGAPFQRLDHFPNGNCKVAYRRKVYTPTKACTSIMAAYSNFSTTTI